jgi:hypothetical protein
MRTTVLPSLAVFALILLPAAQERDPGKPTPNAAEKKSIEAQVGRMQGLWRVREMKTPKLEAARRLDAGFLLVSGLAFSIELHTGYLAPNNKNVFNKDFQSGMHRFELDESGFMETKTIIGSFFNQVGLLEFEQPNKSRRYQVKLGETDMSWTSPEGVTFLFEKLNEPKPGRRDVFGRPLPEKKGESEPK